MLANVLSAIVNQLLIGVNYPVSLSLFFFLLALILVLILNINLLHLMLEHTNNSVVRYLISEMV